jgi:Cdc6-like AAA superfamily ATPase
MRNDMVKTKNVQAAFLGVKALKNPVQGRYGMMLAYGPPGTGKSFFFQKLAMEADNVYVRCKYIDTPRNLLSGIVTELGEEPRGNSGQLFNKAVQQLIAHPRTLIFDEADYIVNQSFVEVIRDINDISNIPVILVGMETVDKRLGAFPHLFDRIRSVVRFRKFTAPEIESLAKEICEVPIDKSGIELIYQMGHGKFRLTIDMFDLAERLQKRNNLKIVTGDHLGEAFHKTETKEKAA